MGLDGELNVAKITFSNQSDYFLRLKNLENQAVSKEIVENAIKKGSAIVADKIRDNLESLSTESFRFLLDGEMFQNSPEGQRRDLVESFGLTSIERDRNGFIHTKAGFDGFGSWPTNSYPSGVPNQLIARAIESGSSIREKTPFVRPAVKATRKKAIAAMDESIDDDLKKIF